MLQVPHFTPTFSKYNSYYITVHIVQNSAMFFPLTARLILLFSKNLEYTVTAEKADRLSPVTYYIIIL